jgi:uncharacterized membrane protein YdjX (TVP38/TMEM64 family)
VVLRVLRNPRVVLSVLAVLALVGAGMAVPHPSPGQMREWAVHVGPVFPVLFFVAHSVICITPFPRTLFTVSAGLLFGPLPGVSLAVSATVVSALLAFLLVRTVGRDAVSRRLTHPTVKAVDRRLARGGWLAVGSLRLVGFAPFSLVNYSCAVSGVRMAPYLIATALGVLPGTIGVVVLGNALTGKVDPLMLGFSAACVAVGVAGFALDMTLGIREAKPKPDLEPAQ